MASCLSTRMASWITSHPPYSFMWWRFAPTMGSGCRQANGCAPPTGARVPGSSPMGTSKPATFGRSSLGNTYGLRTWIEYGIKHAKNELVLCSLNAVTKELSIVTPGFGRPSPDPRFGTCIELRGGDTPGLIDLT